ncbi:hypothetical protein GCM10009555_076760 [Acrocarpospora macrocephala]
MIVKERDSLSAEVQHLLDELCVDLGFCLSPSAQQRLRELPPLSVVAFTDAVFSAEGMDPHLHEDLRRQVRDRIQRRMS